MLLPGWEPSAPRPIPPLFTITSKITSSCLNSRIVLPLLRQPGVHREDKFSIPLIVFFRGADWPFKPLTFKDSILFNPALGPKCLFPPPSLSISRCLSHTDLSALATKESAAQNAGSGSVSIFQRKTKSPRSQFAVRRERHSVNLGTQLPSTHQEKCSSSKIPLLVSPASSCYTWCFITRGAELWQAPCGI